MKKILITGGTGFVGKHLAQLLTQDPAVELHLTTHRSGSKSLNNIFFHSIDLNHQESVHSLIQSLQPQEIYHLAAFASVADSFSQPATVLSNNYHLTLNLLEAARLHSPSSKILLISSADIYDKSLTSPIDENRLIKPTNPYAASKAAQDFLAQAYQQSFNLSIIIARPFNHIGPGQKTGFVVADFASNIIRAKLNKQASIIKVGNLDAKRDFTDVRDMVQAYHLLMSKGQSGEIYNIGSGRTIKISDLLDQLITLSQTHIQVEIDPHKLRPIDYPEISVDNRKITTLGWQPQISFEQTLVDILDYWHDIIKQQI